MAQSGEPPYHSLAKLARSVGATLDGDGSVRIARVATLERAGPHDIAFLTNPRYRPQLAATKASAVIVGPQSAAATVLPKLVSDNPYATYARVAAILHPPAPVEAGVHPTASVDPSARIAASASVGAYAVIGARAVVGERSVIGAHALGTAAQRRSRAA